MAPELTAKQIATFSDDQLASLMRRLLRAQSYLCGADAARVVVNADGNAADGGEDAYSPKPPSADHWLGETETCWQFKAGTQGQPAKIGKEPFTDRPLKTLKNGGRFVIVASGSTNGSKGREDREKAMRAHKAFLSADPARLTVLTSEDLASWCSELPSVAAEFVSPPPGTLTLEAWLARDANLAPWVPNEELREQLPAMRAAISFEPGANGGHLHLEGLPLVGKTRAALEVCRDAPWSSLVLYMRAPSTAAVTSLIERIRNDRGARLVLVVDDAQPKDLQDWSNQRLSCEGRLALVSVTSADVGIAFEHAYTIAPLHTHEMANVVASACPKLSLEHAYLLATFCGGFPGLVRKIAHADVDEFEKHPLQRADVTRGLFRAFNVDHTGLGCVAGVLTSFANGRDVSAVAERAEVACALEVSNSDLNDALERLLTECPLAVRDDRRHELVPNSLGDAMALLAWEKWPTQLAKLAVADLQNVTKIAFFERLKRILAASPAAAAFAREQLLSFVDLSDYIKPTDALRWSCCVAASDTKSVTALLKVLADNTPEQRRAIEAASRRHMVDAIVELMWIPECFDDAAICLALLAEGEAENESWANNARGRFVDAFQVGLAGTPIEFSRRLNVIRLLKSYQRAAIDVLCIRALSRSARRIYARLANSSTTDRVPHVEWKPQTGEEVGRCLSGALTLLVEFAAVRSEETLDALDDAFAAVLQWRDIQFLEGEVHELGRTLACQHPTLCSSILVGLDGLLRHSAATDTSFPQLRALVAELEPTLEDNGLQRFVGAKAVISQTEIAKVAQAYFADFAALMPHWGWLSSAAARGAAMFGAELGKLDSDGVLLAPLLKLTENYPEADHCVLVAYLHAREQRCGRLWLDNVLLEHLESSRAAFCFFAQLGVSAGTCTRFNEMLAAPNFDPAFLESFRFLRWHDRLQSDELMSIASTLIAIGRSDVVLSVAHQRACGADITTPGLEMSPWRAVLLQALNSVFTGTPDDWTKHCAVELVEDHLLGHAEEIASALLQQPGALNHWSAVFWLCAATVPGRCWDLVASYLVHAIPRGELLDVATTDALDMMPFGQILLWIAEDKANRISCLVHLMPRDKWDRFAFCYRLLDQFGLDPKVQSDFASALRGGLGMATNDDCRNLARELREHLRVCVSLGVQQCLKAAITRLES